MDVDTLAEHVGVCGGAMSAALQQFHIDSNPSVAVGCATQDSSFWLLESDSDPGKWTHSAAGARATSSKCSSQDVERLRLVFDTVRAVMVAAGSISDSALLEMDAFHAKERSEIVRWEVGPPKDCTSAVVHLRLPPATTDVADLCDVGAVQSGTSVNLPYRHTCDRGGWLRTSGLRHRLG